MMTADPCKALRGGERFVSFSSFLFVIDRLFNLLKY